jgi:signal transduction histidine kinase/ActR/RegA family two-component response regulator
MQTQNPPSRDELLKLAAQQADRVRVLEQRLTLLNEMLDSREQDHLQVQTLLGQTESQLELAVDAANLALWRWSADTQSVQHSERWAAIIGEPIAEISESFDALKSRFHPEDYPRWVEDVLATVKGHQERFHIIHRFRARHGWIWLETTGKVSQRSSDGTAIELVGTNFDITERRNIEFALELSARKFSSVVQNLQQIVLQLDTTGVVTFVNQAWFFVTGLPAHSLVGKRLTTYTHPADRADLDSCLTQLRLDPISTESDSQSVHLRLCWSTGSQHFTRRFIANLRSLATAAENREALVSLVDVQAQYDAEERLKLARDEAQAASRAKSMFVAKISHEVRTPLNGIIGLSGLLAGSPLTAQQAKWVDLLQASSQSLLTIVNDVLDLTKIEAGELSIQPQTVNVRQWLDEIYEPERPRAQLKGLQFSYAVSSNIPDSVQMDGHRVKQILLNLISNAIKFTAAGEIGLDVKFEPPESNEPPALVFEISDTGCGISEDQLKRIFQPFKQGNDSISREYGGTGLGLPICAQLVRAMGGTLRLRSQVGTGSKFRVQIPIQVTREEVSAAVDAAPAAHKPIAQSLKVLLIEDHPINQLVSKHTLESLGCACVIADNGAKALEILNSQQFDLALVDVQMPVMDGITFAKRWREIESQKKVAERMPLIATTANAYQSDRLACLSAGMDEYLSKPFKPAELKQLIQLIMDR